MVRDGAALRRDVPFQVALDLQGRLAVGKSEPMGDAEDMRVHGDDGLVIDDGAMTFAVLRPTPGRLMSASMSEGTSPPKSASSFCAIAIRCVVFEFG